MILVAGGQLDPNIGALLRRIVQRNAPFRDILVGPDLRPRLRIELDGELRLNDEIIRPTSCFVRHDVFLPQKTKLQEDQRAALNWYQAVRGWASSQPDVRLLNRRGRGADPNKYDNLVRAVRLGLPVPPTVVVTDPRPDPALPQIRKPVAGGELTEALDGAGPFPAYPVFVQPKLNRPEMRIYRVADTLFGFALESPDLDYRQAQRVRLSLCEVPALLSDRLVALCEELGLDFAAADFMRDDEGEWRFLEVNSQPMFAAFDQVASGRLCDAMVSWLISGTARAPGPAPTPGDTEASARLASPIA